MDGQDLEPHKGQRRSKTRQRQAVARRGDTIDALQLKGYLSCVNDFIHTLTEIICNKIRKNHTIKETNHRSKNKNYELHLRQ